MNDVLENENEFLRVLIPKFFNNEIIQQFYQAHELPKQKRKESQTYCKMIQSENTLEMYEGLVGLRITLAEEANNDLSETTLLGVCELNTLKYLIHIIEYNEFQIIIYEALGIFIYLARGSSQVVDQIIENGLINCLIQKFSSGNYHDLIIELICQIFRNLLYNAQIQYSVKYRNLMIKVGVLKILNKYAIEQTKEFENLKLIKILVNSIVVFFKFPFKIPPLKDLQVSLNLFSKWLLKDLSHKTLKKICLAIQKFMEFHSNQLQIIIDLGVMPRIMELINAEDKRLFCYNIEILTNILKSHQHHQEYLYGIGIIPCLGRLIKIQIKCVRESKIVQILEAFEVISNSKYLSQFLLNSNELDLLLSLFDLYQSAISGKIQVIMINLIESHKNSESSINLIKNNKIIMLFQILASRDKFQLQQCKYNQRILDLCDAYLKEKRHSRYHEELEVIKNQIIQKLK